VVDAVIDVVALTEQQLRAPPVCGAVRSDGNLLAIGVLEDRALMLLDVDRRLTATPLVLAAATH
jgi:chemotaxis signal transduction protein